MKLKLRRFFAGNRWDFMEIGFLLSFLFFLSIFAGVGLASMRVKEDTTDDYLVAGRGMHPA